MLDGPGTTTLYNALNPEALRPITALRGGGHTFDFTATAYVAFDTTRTTPVACSTGAPGCDVAAFAEANVRHRHSNDEGLSYAYYRVGPDAVRLLGLAARSDYDSTRPGEETLLMTYTPAARTLALPLTATSAWTDAYTMEMAEQGGPPVLTSQIRTRAAVRAWGTLVTPAGPMPALMLEEARMTTTQVFGGIVRDTSITYTFLTGGDVQAEVALDPESNTVSASYSRTTRTATAQGPLPVAVGLSLAPPSPNPARAAVAVGFTLDAPGRVSLTVHDALGREVARLADGAWPAGAHALRWDAEGHPAGAYALRLMSGGAMQSRTVTLVR